MQHSRRKMCQDTGFVWSVFPGIRIKSKILSLYGKIRARENPYSSILYAALISVDNWILKTSAIYAQASKEKQACKLKSRHVMSYVYNIV